jgi:hypothetical protein
VEGALSFQDYLFEGGELSDVVEQSGEISGPGVRDIDFHPQFYHCT